jgi:hypothetical protein
MLPKAQGYFSICGNENTVYTTVQEREEFDIQSFRTLLSSPSDFSKIRRKEGRTLPLGAKAITFTHAP